MPSSRPTLAVCLVLQGETLPALDADVRRAIALADEVVVYDTADHAAPGTAAFAASLHPAVTVVHGSWAEDRDRAQVAALAHVAAEWALCLLPGERVEGSGDVLRDVLAVAADARAMSVRVDDVVRGTHRSARLLHREGPGTTSVPDADAARLPEVPSAVLRVCQPVATTAGVPRQRGIFDRV